MFAKKKKMQKLISRNEKNKQQQKKIITVEISGFNMVQVPLSQLPYS